MVLKGRRSSATRRNFFRGSGCDKGSRSRASRAGERALSDVKPAQDRFIARMVEGEGCTLAGLLRKQAPRPCGRRSPTEPSASEVRTSKGGLRRIALANARSSAPENAPSRGGSVTGPSWRRPTLSPASTTRLCLGAADAADHAGTVARYAEAQLRSLALSSLLRHSVRDRRERSQDLSDGRRFSAAFVRR